MARALTAAGHTVIGLSRGEADGVAADLLDREALLRADGLRELAAQSGKLAA